MSYASLYGYLQLQWNFSRKVRRNHLQNTSSHFKYHILISNLTGTETLHMITFVLLNTHGSNINVWHAELLITQSLLVNRLVNSTIKAIRLKIRFRCDRSLKSAEGCSCVLFRKPLVVNIAKHLASLDKKLSRQWWHLWPTILTLPANPTSAMVQRASLRVLQEFGIVVLRDVATR